MNFDFSDIKNCIKTMKKDKKKLQEASFLFNEVGVSKWSWKYFLKGYERVTDTKSCKEGDFGVSEVTALLQTEVFYKSCLSHIEECYKNNKEIDNDTIMIIMSINILKDIYDNNLEVYKYHYDNPKSRIGVFHYSDYILWAFMFIMFYCISIIPSTFVIIIWALSVILVLLKEALRHFYIVKIEERNDKNKNN